MKWIALLFPLSLWAQSLSVVNNTGAQIRILYLRNKCQGDIIKPVNLPFYLNKNEVMVVLKPTPVIHTYEICGSGLCVQSAVGIEDIGNYILNVTLDKDGYLTITPKPYVWPGNIDCPKEGK